MDNKKIFANNLKHYMEINGKSRQDICNSLGFNYYTVSDWVNGKKYPRMDKVELLAEYFGILKSDLVEEKGYEEKSMNTDAAEILNLYRQLSPENKILVKKIISSMLEDL